MVKATPPVENEGPPALGQRANHRLDRTNQRAARHELGDGLDVAVERPVARHRRDAARTAACAAATPRLGRSGAR